MILSLRSDVLEKPECPTAKDVEQEMSGRVRAAVRRDPEVRILPLLPISEFGLQLEPAAAPAPECFPTARGHDVGRHLHPPLAPPA